MAAVRQRPGRQRLPELSEISTADYWRNICPGLHVCDAHFRDAAAEHGMLSADPPCTAARVGWTRQRLVRDGYATVTAGELCWPSLHEVSPGKFVPGGGSDGSPPAAHL